MSKKRITYIHIFIWLFAICANLPYSSLTHSSPPLQIVSNIIGFLYLMVVFYLFYLVMVPFLVTRKRLDLFFIISFLVVLIMPFFGYTLLFTARALFKGSFHNFYNEYSFKMHMSGYFPVLTAAVFGSFFGVIIHLRIICAGKKVMTLQSFAKIEESLPDKKFCRVHKSYIVAIDKIKSIERGIIIIADQRIPVSNTYKDIFFSKIKM